MLVLNNGVPKSGSTWVQRVLRRGMTPAYPSENWMNNWSNPSIDRERIVAYAESGEWQGQTVLVKTHLVYEDDLAPLLREDVCIIVSYRNLADSVVSMFHHQVRSGAADKSDPAAWFATSGMGFARRCISHKQSWMDKPGVLMMRYEDMLSDTESAVRQILVAAGGNPSDQYCVRISAATRRDDIKGIQEGQHIRTAGRSVAKEELPADIYDALWEMQPQMDSAPAG